MSPPADGISQLSGCEMPLDWTAAPEEPVTVTGIRWKFCGAILETDHLSLGAIDTMVNVLLFDHLGSLGLIFYSFLF